MFPEPPRPQLTLSAHFMLCTNGEVTYTQYKGKTRLQCDECVWVLYEARGIGSLPRSARIIRNLGGKVGMLIMYLCRGHEALWRKIDGK